MAVAEEIVVTINANADKFNRSMQKAANDTDAFKRKVNAASVTLGTRFRAALTTASASAVKLGRSLTLGLSLPLVAIAGFAIRATARLETLKASFQVLTGSVAKGNKLFSEIIKFSDVTPFTPEDLAESAKVLLSFGISVEELVPTLRMLGDVAGDDSNRLKSLAVVFGQVASNGKLMGQDLLQMINQGFNPLLVLSEKTGKSMSQLRDDMSKGKIGIDQVIEAFRLATSEGGLFFENLKKQSLTLGGIFSTLAGSVTLFLDALGQIIVTTFQAGDGLVNLTASTRAFTDTIKELAAEFPTFTKFLVLLAASAALIGPALLLAGKALGLIVALNVPLALVVAGLVAATGAAALLEDAATSNSESWLRFSEFIVVSMEGIRFAFAKVVESIKFAWNTMLNEMHAFFAAFIDKINEGIAALPFIDASDGIQKLSNSLRQNAETAETWEETIKRTTDAHQRNLEVILNQANAIRANRRVTKELSEANVELDETAGAVTETLEKTGGAAGGASKSLDSLLNSVGGLTTRLRNQKSVLAELEQALARQPARYNEISEAIELQKQKIQELESGGSGSFSALSSNVESFEDAVVGAMTGSKNSMNDFFESLLKQVSSALLKSAISDLTRSLGFKGGSSGGGFSSSSSSSGGGFLSGIVGGIGSAVSSGISSIFGGFFADGGRAPANKFSVVGERGPEIIMPSSPLDVVPVSSGGRTSSTGGSSGGIVQNIILNNQIDARGAAPNTEQRIRNVIEQEEPRIIKRAVGQAIGTLRFEVNRGGQLAKEMGRRRS